MKRLLINTFIIICISTSSISQTFTEISDNILDLVLSSAAWGDYDNDESLDQNNIPQDWIVYEIENVGIIAIPPSLELRDNNSYIALAADIVFDDIRVNKKLRLLKSNLTFQPKGVNERNKYATLLYSRILVHHTTGSSGDFLKYNEKMDLTENEKMKLNEQFRNEVIAPMESFGIKLIQWYPPEYNSDNELSYIKISYNRQMKENPIIYTELYKFFNDNEFVELTLSYRLSEKNIWAEDFSKVYKTFNFLNKM